MVTIAPINPRIRWIGPDGYLTKEAIDILVGLRGIGTESGGSVTLNGIQTLTNKTMDGDLNTFQDIATGSLKTRTGLDGSVVTGTAGAVNDLGIWDANGDIIGIA